jgi:hypothetical protein
MRLPCAFDQGMLLSGISVIGFAESTASVLPIGIDCDGALGHDLSQ